VPLNARGTELGGTFAYSGVNVDSGIPHPPKITGKAMNYGINLSQPLDQERTWVADAGLNWRFIRSYVNHDLVSEDNISSIQLGLNFNRYDHWGRTFARGQTTFAPAWMGSNRTFWKSEGYLTRLIALPANNLLIIRGAAQFTPDALPSAEQFQVGGAFSVRGFTEGLLTGDRGYSFGVEHRWPIPGLKKINPWLAERIQGASFFDIGQTWLDRSSTRFVGGISNQPDRTLLMGAGAGLRIQLSRLAQGFVDFGFGLTDQHKVEPNAQPSFRVHFGVRSNLLPEDYKARGQDVTVLQAPRK
jgi:hemolysin activation/secretion protein